MYALFVAASVELLDKGVEGAVGAYVGSVWVAVPATGHLVI